MRPYALALLSLAGVAVAVLLVVGAAWPPLGACLVLALPLTLCMNRFVFFPNEVGATAEAATIFAAIVAFRSESAVLGPVLLALLVGTLDGRHWERRAFLRMSYNSGSQALTVLATAGVFALLTSATGSSTAGLLTAAVLAALVYLALETAFGVVLVVLLGESTGAAFRHQLPTNALVVPLGVFGAAVGVAISATGSWWCAVALLPTAFVPELVLVNVRRASWGPRALGAVVLGACGLVALVVFAVDRVAPEPQLSASVGIAVLALVLAGDARPPRLRSFPSCLGVVFAAAAGLAATPWLVVVCIAGVVVASYGGSRPWERLWALPLALAVAMLAVAVGASSLPAGLSTVVGVVVLVAMVATWGALPWPSRVIAPWAAMRARWWPIVVLAILSAGCFAASLWCLVVADPLAGRIALATAGGALACAAAAVRQWRFAPTTRRRDATQVAVGMTLLAVVGPLGVAPSPVVAVAASAVTTSISIAVALRCAVSVRRARERSDERLRG